MFIYRQALTSMLEESTTGTNLSRKATLLMAEILCMANRVLPLSLAAKIQASPSGHDIPVYCNIFLRPSRTSFAWLLITTMEKAESLGHLLCLPLTVSIGIEQG